MRFLLTTAAVCALLVAGMLPGFNTNATAEPKASDILKAASEYLAQSQSLRVSTNISYLMQKDGVEESGTTAYELNYTRPKHFALHLENSDVKVLWIANDSGLTTYIPEFGQYMHRGETPDLVALVTRAGFDPIQSAVALLAEFVKDAPFNDILADTESISYEGKETIDGMEVHHLQIGEESGESWDLWVETGDRPLIRRIRPDVSDILVQLYPDDFLDLEIEEMEALDITFEIDMDFSGWTLNASKKGDYTFAPDSGAIEVTRFQPPEPQPEAMQLLGKRAPEFTLKLMNGGTLDIASKFGKEIVVLDFWATWCGPCRMAMPIISSVTDEFADDGVRLYAVNLQETTTEINNFLKGESLDVVVALDTEGTVGAQYLAYSIPETVIIGKDGTVQVVHVGVGPTLEETLRDELQRLVDGEVLATR